jgi:hypothetical protein
MVKGAARGTANRERARLIRRHVHGEGLLERVEAKRFIVLDVI